MKVIGIGRLVRDVEIAKTPSNVTVAKFSVAWNNTKKETSYFIDCIALGLLGDTIATSFKKGERILIDGELQTRTYENKDGYKVKVTEIKVNGFEFIEKKAKTETTETQRELEVTDDDLPF